MKIAKACLHLIVWAVILVTGYRNLEPIAAELLLTAILIGIAFIIGAILMSRFIKTSVENTFGVVVVIATSGAILFAGRISAYFIEKSEYPVIQGLVAISLVFLSFIGVGKILNLVRKPSENPKANQI